ncbi:MAG: DNA-binding protein [Methylocystaceae bacterium]|nr:DNA-binding protein [Methylocystaceae bacterium]
MVETATNKLIGLDETAKQLGVCSAHLRKLIKTGKISFIDIGSRTRPSYRFRQADIDEFIRGRIRICHQKSPASLNEGSIGTTTSKYEVIDFVARRASANVAKPKGGWLKRKKTS